MTFWLSKCCRMAFLHLLKFRTIAKPVRQNVKTHILNKYNISKLHYLIPENTQKNRSSPAPLLCFTILSWLGLEDPEEKEDDELIITIKRSILLIRRKEYPKAEQMLHLSLRLAQQLQNELAITYIYDVMANLALECNQLDKAYKLFINVAQRLLANGVKEDDLKVVHINLKLARINHLNTDLALAQTGYEWSLQKLESFKHEPNSDGIKLLGLNKNWYGHLLLDGGKSKEAIDYLLDAYSMYLEFDDKEDEQIVIQLNDIATAYEKNEDYNTSEKYFLRAIEKGKSLPDFEYRGIVYINLGRLYMKQGLYDIARKRCGFGWRLGYDKSNKEIQNEAKDCLKEIEKITG